MGNYQVKNLEDKKISGTTFALALQIIFNTSVSHKMQQDLIKKFGNGKGRLVGVSGRLKKDFLKDFFNANSEEEVIKNNTNIKKCLKKFKEQIIDETGLEGHEFQNWVNEKLNKYLKEEKK